MRTPSRRPLFHLCIVVVITITASIAWAQDPIDPNTPGACVTVTTPCVTTYHNDKSRDGVQPNESILNSTLIAAGTFGFIGSSAANTSTVIDGLIYAQPLYLTGITMKLEGEHMHWHNEHRRSRL
ncbi:MAG TPA: hypothetical protein VGM18_20145 [Candidatus Sulfotelmatobacter sp.]